MSNKITVEQLVSTTNLDRTACYGLLRFLEESGLATRSAADRPKGKRGRSTAVYTVHETFAVSLQNMLGQAFETLVPAGQPANDVSPAFEVDEQPAA